MIINELNFFVKPSLILSWQQNREALELREAEPKRDRGGPARVRLVDHLVRGRMRRFHLLKVLSRATCMKTLLNRIKDEIATMAKTYRK